MVELMWKLLVECVQAQGYKAIMDNLNVRFS